MIHSATDYAKQVCSGKTLACRWVRLACERHLSDLKRKDIFFDEAAADHALTFFSFVRHSKGEWSGKPFELEPWQKFIVGSIFGWKRSDGLRRFRTAYICVSRKNGKSTLIAGIGLYLFFADGEPGSEVYTAATKREQAIIVHSEATRMVKASPALKSRIKIFKNNLNVEATASKFEPLGADSKTYDGLNVHGAIIDELHAHPDRGMWDVLETATGARRQPLLVAITTAGFDQSGICYEQQEYVEKILVGTIQDDSYFGVIYTLDKEKKDTDGVVIEPGDDWADEACWIKSNPNLGVSVKKDDLQRKAQKAKEIPAAQNNFLTKHMDVWTQQATRWISLDLWDENAVEIKESELAGMECYGGVDLSSVSDLTVWVMGFRGKDDPERVDFLCRVWCPEARLFDKKNRYRDQYQSWKKQGYLYTTEGDAVDYDFVRSKIVEDAKRFKIQEVRVDRLFQGYEFSIKLDEELGGNEKSPKVVACGMGYLSMAAPCKEFETLLLKRKLNHGGNPILRFCADNVSITEDPAGNKKPNKATSQGKIDGIIGMLLAIDGVMRSKPQIKLRMPFLA